MGDDIAIGDDNVSPYMVFCHFSVRTSASHRIASNLSRK